MTKEPGDHTSTADGEPPEMTAVSCNSLCWVAASLNVLAYLIIIGCAIHQWWLGTAASFVYLLALLWGARYSTCDWSKVASEVGQGMKKRMTSIPSRALEKDSDEILPDKTPDSLLPRPIIVRSNHLSPSVWFALFISAMILPGSTYICAQYFGTMLSEEQAFEALAGSHASVSGRWVTNWTQVPKEAKERQVQDTQQMIFLDEMKLTINGTTYLVDRNNKGMLMYHGDDQQLPVYSIPGNNKTSIYSI